MVFLNCCYQNVIRVLLSTHTNPKYFSKKDSSLLITPCFFSALLPPPPKRDTGGRILSTSIPVVFKTPSRKAFSTSLRVSSDFNFSASIRVAKSASFCSRTNLCQSSSTLMDVLILVINPSIEFFVYCNRI